MDSEPFLTAIGAGHLHMKRTYLIPRSDAPNTQDQYPDTMILWDMRNNENSQIESRRKPVSNQSEDGWARILAAWTPPRFIRIELENVTDNKVLIAIAKGTPCRKSSSSIDYYSEYYYSEYSYSYNFAPFEQRSVVIEVSLLQKT